MVVTIDPGAVIRYGAVAPTDTRRSGCFDLTRYDVLPTVQRLEQVAMSSNAIYTDLSAYYDVMCADIDYRAQNQCACRLGKRCAVLL